MRGERDEGPALGDDIRQQTTSRGGLSHDLNPCASSASSASIDTMATLTIRRLDDNTKARLRVRAAHHGRSMEEEAREILRSALSVPPRSGENLAESIRELFAPLGGVELELPPREPIRRPPAFK